MKQLSGLDASWLYTETSGVFGHVCGVSIYERPSRSFQPYEAVRARLASLLGELEPLRRRLVEVPLRLDHPYLVTIPTSTSTVTCTVSSFPLLVAPISSASSSPTSPAGPWTAPARCGTPTSWTA